MPGPEKINNFRVGDSREGLLRNTSFLLRNNASSTGDRSTLGMKRFPYRIDFTVDGRYQEWIRYATDRVQAAVEFAAVAAREWPTRHIRLLSIFSVQGRTLG